MILFHHTKHRFAVSPMWLSELPLNHGVSFFFVLSGFILTYSYPSFSCSKDVMRFFVARVARLWPVHLFSLLVLFVALPLSALGPQSPELWQVMPFNLLMVHAWVPLKAFYFSLNAVSWSVSDEWFFYLCFPVLIQNWENTWPRKLLLASVLIGFMIVLGNWLGLPGYSAGQEGLTTQSLVYVNPIARLFEFVLGMTGIILWRRIQSGPSLSVLRATSAELVAVGLTIYWMIRQPMKEVPFSLAGQTGAEWLGHSGSCIAFALLIPILAHGRGLLARALSIGVLVTLGEISYSIYMLHQVVLRIIDARIPSMAMNLSAARMSMLWILFIAVAYCVWRFIEIPARQGMLRAWDRRASRTKEARLTAGGVG
jgi:peptidoglycan/LPS O-acetylase OafA/YrhL